MIKRLELFYPLHPKQEPFQKFGESLACTEDKPGTPISKRKVVGKVNGVCPLGFVELYPLLGMKGHTGLDLYAILNQPIYASQDGIVVEINTEEERGLGIDIVTKEKFFMDSFGDHYAKYRNWHLKTIFVTLGQRVKIGDMIGAADSTGLSSGNHDHFELKPVEKYQDGTYYNTEASNGYYGAIDSMPFMSTMTAYQVRSSLTAIAEALKRISEILALYLKSRK